MSRSGLLGALLLAAAAARGGPAEDYQRFFRSEISGKWADEDVSEQRVVMVRGFEKHDLPEAAEWLLEEVLAKDPAGDVLREAVRVLGKYKQPETVAAMAEAWSKKLKRSWEARALALLAFGAIKGEAAEGPLADGLEDKDERVVICACRAIGSSNRVRFRPDLVKLLKDKHPAVRGAAALALGELGGDEAMPEIFQVFCLDKSDRVRYDAWLALRKLAMEPDLPCDPDAWRDWWDKMTMIIPEGDPNPWGKSFPRLPADYGRPGNFFRIPLLADRIAFVVDASLDMDNPWRIHYQTERKKPRAERIPRLFSVKTRWDLVSSYCMQALGQMGENTEFCFTFFNNEVALHPDKGRFLKNKSSAREKLRETLEAVKRGGSTDMYAGLTAAWGFLKAGNPDYNFDRGVDTIVFVTDGQPRWGEMENREDRLRDEVWRVAVTRNLRVHAVGLYNHAFELLKAMAEDSGGLYVHAQPAGDDYEPQDLDFWPAKKKAFEEARKKKRTPGTRPG